MIKDYTPEHLDAVMDIWYRASTLAHPFLSEAFTQKVAQDMRTLYLPNPDSKTAIFEQDGKVVGFISMIGNEIGGLFVHPDHHSQGIGRALVNYVSGMHKQLEVEVFENNRIGRPFYEKYGFEYFKEYLHETSQQQVLRMRWIKP